MSVERVESLQIAGLRRHRAISALGAIRRHGRVRRPAEDAGHREDHRRGRRGSPAHRLVALPREARAKFPPGIFAAPKLGLKKVGILHEKLGVGVWMTRGRVQSGRVAKLKGFGRKTRQKILEGIAYAQSANELLLPIGIDVGSRFASSSRTSTSSERRNQRSVRRRLEIIRNVNIVVVARPATRHEGAREHRRRFGEPRYQHDQGRGAQRSRCPLSPLQAPGVRIDAAAHRPDRSSCGRASTRRRQACEDRGGDFQAGGGAVRRAGAARGADDLRLKSARARSSRICAGPFTSTPRFQAAATRSLEMLTAAHQRGFEYVGMSDHSKSAYYAGG